MLYNYILSKGDLLALVSLSTIIGTRSRNPKPTVGLATAMHMLYGMVQQQASLLTYVEQFQRFGLLVMLIVPFVLLLRQAALDPMHRPKLHIDAMAGSQPMGTLAAQIESPGCLSNLHGSLILFRSIAVTFAAIFFQL